MEQNNNHYKNVILSKAKDLGTERQAKTGIPRVTRNDKAYGFTLVELAIALMVIGLLIGGVLKGQELIENAKITATVRQFNDYNAAILIFRNTYNALPGDIKRPNRIPNCTEEVCTLGGNGNGKIHWSDTTLQDIESYNFFPHLTKAGLIQGPEGGTQAQYNQVDSDMWHLSRDLFFPELPIGFADSFDFDNSLILLLTTKHWAALDEKMDDGHPKKGIIRPEEVPLLDTDEDGKMDAYDINNSSTDLLTGWLWLESVGNPPAPWNF